MKNASTERTASNALEMMKPRARQVPSTSDTPGVPPAFTRPTAGGRNASRLIAYGMREWIRMIAFSTPSVFTTAAGALGSADFRSTGTDAAPLGPDSHDGLPGAAPRGTNFPRGVA